MSFGSFRYKHQTTVGENSCMHRENVQTLPDGAKLHCSHRPTGMHQQARNTMPRVCAAVNCGNSTYSLQRWKSNDCQKHRCKLGTSRCDCQPPFRLFPFPTQRTNPALRQRWVWAINRINRLSDKDWDPKEDARVCSKHFVDGEPSSENPVPTLHLGHMKRTPVPRKAPEKRFSFDKPDVLRGSANINGETFHPTNHHQECSEHFQRGGYMRDVHQLVPTKEEQRPDVDQQDPEPVYVKKETEDDWSSLEAEQLNGTITTEVNKFGFTSNPLRSEDDEDKPFPQLYMYQVEDGEPLTSTSADPIKASACGEDFTEIDITWDPDETDSCSAETYISEADDEEDEDPIVPTLMGDHNYVRPESFFRISERTWLLKPRRK